jgi:hypothetical protein
MSKVCHECEWWVGLNGKNPNTGVDVCDWHCAVAWFPLMQVEVANAARSGAAATESFREEMVRRADRPSSAPRLERAHVVDIPQISAPE